MADFDLTQTDAQVQSILNDAQDAQGAGAQTTLTTDYIMLKGTNGRYHKILKDSFTEAVRNVLAGLLVNNDKGTTISQIPAISSGDFGSVTPANLASVLGVGNTGGGLVHVGSQVTSFTISKNNGINGSVQGILFITQNGPNVIPTVYSCSRTSLTVLFQGTTDITSYSTFNENGDIVITKNANSHFYYRIFFME